MLLHLFASIVLACIELGPGQAGIPPLTTVSVTISPAKTTIYAGEMQAFAAAVIGTDEQSVNWSVEEEGGGSITDSGLYTAPKIQGVYHVMATSRRNPQKKAVAIIIVLAYCDPPHTVFKP